MAWLSGWSSRQKITIASSTIGLSGNVADLTIPVHIANTNTSFWAGVKADGTDVRFTASDGSTLLKFEVESFDNTGDDAWYQVKIPTLTSASNVDIYVYYGNAAATSGEDINNTWDANFKGVWHLNQDKAAGAFADSTSNANNGTNNGTTDVAGKIDRGRTFTQASSQDISVADANSLSFGNGVTDTALTIEAWVKMADATKFRIVNKGDTASTNDREYVFCTTGTDNLVCFLFDYDGNNYISQSSNSALTADEGSWVHLAVTYDGAGLNTGITIYRNGAVVSSTGGGAGTYVAMENLSKPVRFGSYYGPLGLDYASGDMDEITISAVGRSADWIKARYNAGLATWLTFSGEEGNSFTMAGGGVAGGSAPTQQIAIFLPDGGGVVGGAADYLFAGGGYYTMAGGGVAGGSADIIQKILNTMSGGGVVGGTAQYSFTTTALYIPIIWFIHNANTPITGGDAATGLKIRRLADGYMYDWSDSTFKQAGWTTLSGTLSEMDSTNLAGYYKREVNVATWSDGWYLVDSIYSGTPLQHSSMEVLIMGGKPVDYRVGTNADALTSSRLAAADYTAPDNVSISSLLVHVIGMSKWKNNKMERVSVVGAIETWVLYDDNNETPLLTWTRNTVTNVRTKAT